MKKLLIILQIVIPLSLGATNYYIDPAGSDVAAGTAPETAWASIARVNTAWAAGTFGPADSILFRRGNTWHGTITVAEAGIAGSPIVIGAYGTGADPIITGFTTLSSWTSVGDTVYYAALSPASAPEMVTIDGVQYAMGRYPNEGTWITVGERITTTRIKGTGLTSSPDWTGAELVIRENRWIISNHAITDHGNDTITFSTAMTYNPTGYGFFIRNDYATLNAENEWFYDGSTNRFYLHTANPAILTVEVSTVDYGVSLGAYEFIHIVGLNITGMNKGAVYANFGDYDPHGIKVDGCTISYIGGDGIYINRSSADTIINSSISYCNNSAITMWGNYGNYCYIKGNDIQHIGTIVGGAFNWYGGTWANNAYNAIYINPDKSEVSGNRITYTGYIPINFRGDSALIQNNYISHYCFVKDDGAGTYVYDCEDPGKRVIGNIILYGLGASGGMSAGSSISAHGIYTDGEASNVLFKDNVIGYMATSAYHGNIPRNVTIQDNLFFQCPQFLNMWRYTSDEGYITGMSITRNKFISTVVKDNLPAMIFYQNSGSAYYTNLSTEIAYMGTIDSNYYYLDSNIENHAYILLAPESETGIAPYSLQRWTDEFGHDIHSVLIDTLQLYTIKSLSSNFITNGTFDSNITGWTGSANAPISWDNTNALGDGGSILLSTQLDPHMYYWWENTYDIYTSISTAIDNSKYYIFRGEVKSDLEGKTIAFKTRTTGTGYESQRFLTVGIIPQQKEILLSGATTVGSPATFRFASCDDIANVWFDNLEFYEADVTLLDETDYLHLLYNDGITAETYFLSSTMTDASGVSYSGSVTLNPFEGVLLIGTGTVRTTPFQSITLKNSSGLPLKSANDNLLIRN